MKPICIITALYFIAFTATSQQMADSSFDGTVKDPWFKNQHPKVLFDEAHSNFHTAGGRYKPFADLITSDGCVVTPNTAKFSSGEVFKGYDLLVIANAMNRFDTTAFTDEECDVIKSWIQQGGNLLLITDHMPMSKLAKPLADKLGISFTIGTVMDSLQFEPKLERSHLSFTRENKLLADNEFTKGLNKVVSFTGQGVKGPAGSIPILLLSPTAYHELIELADFKKTETGINVKIKRFGFASAAGYTQATAFQLGKGRVIVTGEAAMLTAQVSDGQKAGMNFPDVDNKLLVLNMVRWLLR